MKKSTAYAWLGLLAAPAMFDVAAAQSQTQPALEPLVVTATRTGIRREEAPTGYSEIGREDLQRTPAATLADMLRDVPGISLEEERDGRSLISVRGLNPEHTLILLNGRRLNVTDELIGHSDFRMAQIPVAAIERIEVVRGPTSSLYGADALGGVINVITRTPEEWTTTLGTRYGWVDRQSGGSERVASLFTGGPIGERVGATFGLDVYDRSPARDRQDPAMDHREGRESFTGYGSLDFRPNEASRWELFLNVSDDERDTTTGPGRDDWRGLELRRYSAGIRHDYQGETWSSRVDLYRSRSDSEEVQLSREEVHTDDVLDISASRDWGGHHTLTLAGDVRFESFQRERAGAQELDESVRHRGALVQNRSYLLDDRLILTLGTRLDDHSRYDSQLSPRVGGVYALTGHTRLKADYARGFAAPDLRRSSPDFIGGPPMPWLAFVGNPDLEPERTDSYALGIEHDAGPWHASATLFRNEVKDLIDAACIANCGSRNPRAPEIREYSNVERARTQGVELEAGWRPGETWRLRGNYTYLEARDRQTDQRLERRPRQRFNLLAEAELWPGGRLNLRGEYIGDQCINDENASGYTLWHAGVRQELTPQLSLRAGVENLTDRQLYEVDDAYGHEVRGRFYHASVNWEF